MTIQNWPKTDPALIPERTLKTIVNRPTRRPTKSEVEHGLTVRTLGPLANHWMEAFTAVQDLTGADTEDFKEDIMFVGEAETVDPKTPDAKLTIRVYPPTGRTFDIVLCDRAVQGTLKCFLAKEPTVDVIPSIRTELAKPLNGGPVMDIEFVIGQYGGQINWSWATKENL